jgi:hypothetical protein
MNLDRSVVPTILAVLKLLEANFVATRRNQAVPYGSPSDTDFNVESIISQLSDGEKVALRKILLSMILMTSGAVHLIRNPESYDGAVAESLGEIISDYAKIIWSASGGPNPDSYTPTKSDYALAKQILPFVSSLPTDRKRVLAILKGRGMVGGQSGNTQEDDIKIADTLYRGLNSLSSRHLMYLFYTNKPTWDIQRSVSTSKDVNTAKAFMMKKKPWRLLIEINNANGQGFHAGDLSKYDTEEEYILSGILSINEIEMVFSSKQSGADELLEISISSAGGNMTGKIGDQTFEGKDASNLFLSIMTHKSDPEEIEQETFSFKGKTYLFTKHYVKAIAKATIQN